MKKTSTFWLMIGLVLSGFIMTAGWLVQIETVKPMDPTALARIWAARLIGSAGFVGFVLLFFKLRGRKDSAPDYLLLIDNPYFDRKGFCFVVRPATDNGQTCLDLFFMSQYDQPSVATVAIRSAAMGLLQKRAAIPPISYRLECPPAGFGCVRIPFSFPTKLQGCRQKFDLAATVEYPNGRGRRVRFFAGLDVGTNADFGSQLTNGRFADLLGATLNLSKPASVEFLLPSGTSEPLPASALPEYQVLWKMGDPELDKAELKPRGATV